MNSESLQRELQEKENNGEKIAAIILQNPGLIPDIISGTSSSSANLRFKCAKILRITSESTPEVLYPYFEFFETLLESENNIIKWNAMDIIANLTIVDTGDKFDCIIDKYYRLFNQGSLITSAHVVENSGKIARGKPHFREVIANEILKVSDIPLPTAECRSILAGKVILTLSNYPELVTDKNRVISFLTGQLNSTRNATRKKAEILLKRLVAA